MNHQRNLHHHYCPCTSSPAPPIDIIAVIHTTFHWFCLTSRSGRSVEPDDTPDKRFKKSLELLKHWWIHYRWLLNGGCLTTSNGWTCSLIYCLPWWFSREYGFSPVLFLGDLLPALSQYDWFKNYIFMNLVVKMELATLGTECSADTRNILSTAITSASIVSKCTPNTFKLALSMNFHCPGYRFPLNHFPHRLMPAHKLRSDSTVCFIYLDDVHSWNCEGGGRQTVFLTAVTCLLALPVLQKIKINKK